MMVKKYTVAAFEDSTLSDMAHDLAAMVDYLIEGESENSRHYGLILFHKIIRDNLIALGDRVQSERESTEKAQWSTDLAQGRYCSEDVTNGL